MKVKQYTHPYIGKANLVSARVLLDGINPLKLVARHPRFRVHIGERVVFHRR
jgi:hypothetical protein